MYIEKDNLAFIAKSDQPIYLFPKMANRHGLIAGATGTGKTVTLKVFAEAFSDMGVPVFLADIKGDLTGMCIAGERNEHIEKRVKKLGLEGFDLRAYPTRFFDVYGKKGIPVRTTISDMGPQLLARIMNLNDTQTGILNIIFKIADDKKLLLLDLKDLRAMVQYVGDHRDEYKTSYGNVSTQSVGTIQRGLLELEDEGGNVFFGEPALDLSDWMDQDKDGKGFINVLECQELFQHPILYSTFLLWMLSDLYENLPEAGDMDKPKMVFFFDEAHLLFKDAPKALLDKVEQIVRLIRSKGVGVYFVTQTPQDVPDAVLAQLGNKVQHALRAFTPSDQKAVKATAQSFRANPKLDCESVLQELGTGEALVSFLDEEGVPGIVQRSFILPPMSSMNAAGDSEKDKVMKDTPLYEKYTKTIDRESAYEDINAEKPAVQESKEEASVNKAVKAEAAKEAKAEAKAEALEAKKAATKAKQVDKVIGNTLSTFGREVTKQLVRGIFGSLKR